MPGESEFGSGMGGREQGEEGGSGAEQNIEPGQGSGWSVSVVWLVQSQGSPFNEQWMTHGRITGLSEADTRARFKAWPKDPYRDYRLIRDDLGPVLEYVYHTKTQGPGSGGTAVEPNIYAIVGLVAPVTLACFAVCFVLALVERGGK